MSVPAKQAASNVLSLRSRLFVIIAFSLGVAQLVSLSFHWHSADPRRFFIYLFMAAAASFFHLNRADRSGGFSLNLPFVLLSIVDLSRPEAVVIGCTAAIIQSLRSPEDHSFRRLSVSLGVQATVISTASFILQSLLQTWLGDPAFRLFIAAVALFIANTFPAAILRRLAEQERLGSVWRSSYFWAFPYYLVGAALAQIIHLGKSAFSSGTALLVLVALYLTYRHYRAQKAEWNIRESHADDVAALHLRAIEGLALAVEAKDNMNTRGHIRRVQIYTLGIGKSMGLARTELEALQAGALLHDIGKLAVPDYILTKPGKLTPEEFAKVKVHPLVGAEIVEQMQFPYPVAPIVRAHHEKWDGSGYPYGLKGESIPIGARILSVADCLDAMISDRAYRKGIPIADAIKQIIGEAGKSFDPGVVHVLEQQYASLEECAKVQAAQGPVLSTDVLVEKGAAPDAGLDLCGLPAGGHGEDFLATITAAAREEQLLRETAAAGTSLDPAEAMKRIDAALRGKISCDALVFFVRHANALTAEYATGKNTECLTRLHVPLGDGLTGWVGQNLQPVVNGNPAVDPGFHLGSGEPLQSVLALPLIGTQGLVAVLALYRSKKDAFSRADLQLVSAVVPNIACTLENALAHQAVESMANLDRLTGACNRSQLIRFLDEELSRARHNEQPVTLLIVEVSGYWRLLESGGQAKVDELLIAVSKGLKQSSRDYDRLGRIADDRFAVVLPGMRPASMTAILNRIRELGVELGTELKLGGSFYPDNGDGARNLLAVGEQKLDGPNQRWEESLRALLRVGGTAAADDLDAVRVAPRGDRRAAR